MPFFSPRFRSRVRRRLREFRAELKEMQWNREPSLMRDMLLRLVNRALRSM